MTAPQVLGADLSLTATGLALPDGSTCTVSGDAGGLHRMEEIRRQVCGKAVQGAELVVIEGFSFASKGRSIYEIGGLAYLVRLTLYKLGIPFALAPPPSLKKYATGKGSGPGTDKTVMAIAALKRAGREFPDDNQCDAAWLRWAGLDWLGHPEFPMPQAQRDALDGFEWPRLPEGAIA